MEENLQAIAFEIILHSGSARTMIHEAFALMRKAEFEKAQKKLDEANDKLLLAHKTQTSLLSKYANGEEIVMEMIMVHAQDHLMTTMTFREIAIEMKYLYEK